MVSETVHPRRQVLKSYMHSRDIKMVEIPMADGVTDPEMLKKLIDANSAAVMQNPNFFGIVEDFTEIEKITHGNKSLLVSSVDPISLAILKNRPNMERISPWGCPGSGQQPEHGGPYIGFMAVTSKLMRRMPGRMVGQSVDVDGRRAFVLTLQAREQHIRRYKATSNICSNQSLNALTAAIYMVTMGKKGLREVALQVAEKAYYAARRITAGGKYKPAFDKPFFREFALIGPKDADLVNKELLKSNILGGYNLNKEYGIENGVLLCVTEDKAKLTGWQS